MSGLANGRVVAVGADEPLAEHMMVADFFRKLDSRWLMMLGGRGANGDDRWC